MNLRRSILVLACWILALSCRGAATLDIYWIDAEGGAATLIVTPAGETVLIDSGWPTRFKWGGTPPRIKEVLHQAGASKLDYLITTHFDIDHFSATAELASLVPIGTVIDNGIPAKDLKDGYREGYSSDIQGYRSFKADKRHVIQVGESIDLKQKGPKLQLRCLAAQQKFIDPGLANSKPGKAANPLCSQAVQKDPDRSENANSMVLLLSYGDFRFFAGGDLTWNLEEKLVCPVDLVGKVDVYQVDHHGEAISNNPLLIGTISPTVAVMNCGAQKGGKAATFKTLRATASIQTIYQLHKTLPGEKERNTDDAFIANLEEKCAGNYIKCSVAPSGRSYTLSIPAKRFSKTYRTGAK